MFLESQLGSLRSIPPRILALNRDAEQNLKSRASGNDYLTVMPAYIHDSVYPASPANTFMMMTIPLRSASNSSENRRQLGSLLSHRSVRRSVESRLPKRQCTCSGKSACLIVVTLKRTRCSPFQCKNLRENFTDGKSAIHWMMHKL